MHPRRLGALAPALLLWLAGPAHAVEVEAGQRYEGGTRVDFSPLGVSFRIPEGWAGAVAPDGSAFAMTSNVHAGMLLARAEPGGTLEAARTELAAPIPIDESSTLVPVGKPVTAGQRVTARFAGEGGGQKIVAYAAAEERKNGTLVGFVGIGPATDSAALEKRVLSVLGTVEDIAKPKAPAPGESSGPWAKELRGKALLYLKTGGGMSTKINLSLCADGRATYRDGSSYLSQGFSGRLDTGVSLGRWTIQGSRLEVVYDDGSRGGYDLSKRGEQTLLSGTRWFVTDELVCP